MTREKKAIYNVITNIVLQLSLAISGLIIPRLILQAYGSEMNGLINSITQFLTYAALIEMGIGNASIVVLYKPIAENDYKDINRIVYAVKGKYIVSGILYTIIVCIIAAMYPFLAKTNMDYEFVASLVIIIAGSSFIDFFVAGKYKVFLLAGQKYYITNIARTVETILTAVGSCYFLLGGCSVLFVKIFAVLMHLLGAVVMKYYVILNYPELKFNIKGERTYIGQQSNALIHQLASVVVYNTDLVILTLMLQANSLKEASVYTVYALAFGVINNLMTTLTTGFDSTFGDMYARGENESVKKVFSMYEFGYNIILYLMYSCFMVLIVPFVMCYTEGITDVNYYRLEVGILFGLNGILAELKDPSMAIIRAVGHYRETQKIVVIQAIINIVLSLLLVGKMGITGVLIGTLFSHVIADIGFLAYTNHKLIAQSIWNPIKMNMKNLLLLVMLVIIELKLIDWIDNWFKWILSGVVLVLLNTIAFVLWNLIVNRKKMMSLKDLLLKIVKKRLQ